jgi:hypothetical protein
MSDIIVAQPWEVEKHLNPVRNTSHVYLKFLNTSVFSQEALHFLKHGYYTSAPYGSKDWVEYWDEQERRCMDGYTVGGVRITGRHYFFLNFTMMKARPMDPLTGKPGNRKILTFPSFLDHQYYLFHELEECFAEGPHKGHALKGMVILKSRRLGITYVNAGGVIAYNFTFISHSNTVIGSYEQLHYDTLLNGVHFALNHINKSTDWGKRRQKIDRRDHIRASFVYTDDMGMPIEDGYMSEVQAISFKDNPFKTIGASIFTMCFEEAGRFKGLLDAYAIAEPTFRDGHLMTGVPLIWGTGGDVDAGGRDLADMFYNPGAYGLKSYENIYDENTVGECGWFIDALWYAPEVKGDKVQVDAQGNSMRDTTKESLMKTRDRQAKGNRSTYRKFITQSPMTPAEALLRTEGSRFDTLRAQTRLGHILANKGEFIDSIYLAKLIADSESNTIRYEYDPLGIPLREFPIKDFDQAQGCVEIYEQPQRVGADIQPFRYIAGIDSYDDDVSSGNSVGSILVLDKITDRIVAHYKGRPPANKFYETCRRLLKYYNATANYERRNKGIYGYLFNTHCLHLLCDEPNILKDKGVSKANTIGNNSKGTAPSVAVNQYGMELAQTWMDSRAYGEGEESEVTNMDRIRSVALLREIISWNSNNNFDDISALIMLMIYREDLLTVKIEPYKKQSTIMDDPFWGRVFNKGVGYRYSATKNMRNNLENPW